MKNEKFGRLLKAAFSCIANCEGKTSPIIEEEIGQQIGVTSASIQRYKSGHIPPERRTIEILAEAGVKRGYLNREWVLAFLHAVSYPAPEKLAEELGLAVPTNRPRPPRIYQNLPAPTYNHFIMREQAYNEIIDGLSQRSAVVLLAGMGGMGKTSLAREIADHCIKERIFDAAVWVSDKDRPGTTNLSTVLDEIARTLDYPGFTQFEHGEKSYEVEQLLRRQKVLLVVDNFETITDGVLLAWILRLPEPSKALITTREYRREFRRSSWPIDLRGMTDVETQELISNKLRQLKIEKQVIDKNQLIPLLAITSGNPKAIEITLGYIKYQNHPFQQVVDDLYAARGELFDDLFTRCWSLLDEASRRVLLVTTFFPDSASKEALSVTADVQGFAFDSAIERLSDLALLDVQQGDLSKPPRYALHPLVRVFATSKLKEQPNFENVARVNWAKYFTSSISEGVKTLSTKFFYISFLEESDLSARLFLDWAYNTQHWLLFIQVYEAIELLWGIKGLFDVRLAYTFLELDAVRSTGKQDLYIRTLCRLTRIKSYQDDLEIARKYCVEAKYSYSELADEALKREVWPRLLSSEIILLRREGKPQLALETLEAGMNIYRDVFDFRIFCLKVGCLYEADKYQEGQALFHELFESGIHEMDGFETQTMFIMELIRFAGSQSEFAKILCLHISNYLKTENNIDYTNVEYWIEQGFKSARPMKHRRVLAELQLSHARLYILRGEFIEARSKLEEAIDLFDRLGMRKELAEAREELSRLEAGASFRENEAPA